jgi:hypothetical protein
MIPLSDSPSMASIDDRAALSNFLSSRDDVMNVLRTLIRTSSMGGTKTRVIGRIAIAIVTAPSTMKERVRTSERVPARTSSLLPTSAENLSKILPCEIKAHHGKEIDHC